jgi:hypothetical protein
MDSVMSKQRSDASTLRAQHLRQENKELEAANSARDLKVIATTEEAKM